MIAIGCGAYVAGPNACSGRRGLANLRDQTCRKRVVEGVRSIPPRFNRTRRAISLLLHACTEVKIRSPPGERRQFLAKSRRSPARGSGSVPSTGLLHLYWSLIRDKIRASIV